MTYAENPLVFMTFSSIFVNLVAKPPNLS